MEINKDFIEEMQVDIRSAQNGCLKIAQTRLKVRILCASEKVISVLNGQFATWT
jgi:hypothetical protein